MIVAIPKKSLPTLEIHPASLNEEKKRSLTWLVSHHIDLIKSSDELKTMSVESFAKQVESRFDFFSHGDALSERTFYFVVKPDGTADGTVLASSFHGALVGFVGKTKNWTNVKQLTAEIERLKQAGYSVKKLTAKLKLDLEIAETTETL